MLNHPNMPRRKGSVLDRLRNGPTPGVQYLTPDESASWRDKIERCSKRACTPLKFSQAMGDDMPLPLEVVRNDQGRVVVHVFRRPDIAYEKGDAVVAKAIKEVFGPPRPSQIDAKTGELKDCFYRDEEEIRVAAGLKRKVLPTDSWYTEFPEDVSMVLPNTDYLRDKLALAVKNAWSAAG